MKNRFPVIPVFPLLRLPCREFLNIFLQVNLSIDSSQAKVYIHVLELWNQTEITVTHILEKGNVASKVRGNLGGNDYRGMLDLVIVNHAEKWIIPCDLKTSHNREYNFPKSFIEFRYDIQSRLYWRLLRQAMDNDDYFRDFALLDFQFIVVNNFAEPYPLTWKFPAEDCKTKGTIILGGRTLRDPEEIGAELYAYLRERPRIPNGIFLNKPNSIKDWFNKDAYES